MRSIAIVISFLLLQSSVNACLNEYHVNEKGHLANGALDEFSFYHYHYQHNPKQLLKNYDSNTAELKKRFSYTVYSDYGVVLLRAGYYKEGLEVFRYLNKSHPNQYNIVANLGTAYELNGKNDSALLLIRQALKMNNRSHHGSEWIHEAVLVAKINESNSHGWINTHPVLSPTMLKKNNDQLLLQMYYQLSERIPFSAAPDPVLSYVVEAWGDHMIKNLSVSEAWKLYVAAGAYAGGKRTTLLAKIQKAKTLTHRYKPKHTGKTAQTHWPTEGSIKLLEAEFKAYKPVPIAGIKPVLYHKA